MGTLMRKWVSGSVAGNPLVRSKGEFESLDISDTLHIDAS